MVLETFAVTGYPRQVEPGWLQPLLSYPGAADVAVHVEPFPAHLAADRAPLWCYSGRLAVVGEF